MKKLSYLLLSLMCVTLWSCSDDDDPVVDNSVNEVVVSLNDKLSAPNSSFEPQGGVEDG